jgi:hypothetical protein
MWSSIVIQSEEFIDTQYAKMRCGDRQSKVKASG